jgi:Tautomerase enzyme
VFEGRTTAVKQAFCQRLRRDFAAELRIEPVDLEVTVVQTPRQDWAIRGQAGEDLLLAYPVEQ